MRYLEKFILPDEDAEHDLAHKRAEENGGYLDCGYPCMIFPEKELSELDFETTTLFYGGNGSGKSTLLQVIAAALDLQRGAPAGGGELFEPYTRACAYRMDVDEEGRSVALPAHSRMIGSDDVFEYMLAARRTNEERAVRTEEEKKAHAFKRKSVRRQLNGRAFGSELSDASLRRSDACCRIRSGCDGA